MNELDLLGAYAWGASCGSAQLKACAEDFQVDEVLDIPLTGTGEHLWLWVEKRYLNTEEVAKRIARLIHVPVRQISYAGLKDRLALTRQWFSVHLAGKPDPDLTAIEDEQLRIIKRIRHQRKLQRGTHSGNGFTIRLTGLDADHLALEQKLQCIAREGVPNYFGLQRFGHDGYNVSQAFEYASQQKLPEQRTVRSRLLSSARSYLFNKVLASRVAEGTWNKVIDGDVLSFTNSRSFFMADEHSQQDPRLAGLDLHPTGPLWGDGELAGMGQAKQLEQQVIANYPSLANWLVLAKMRQERRILRLPVGQLQWHFPEANILQLAFVLPMGCFATAVVRELVSLNVTDNTCTY